MLMIGDYGQSISDGLLILLIFFWYEEIIRGFDCDAFFFFFN